MADSGRTVFGGIGGAQVLQVRPVANLTGATPSDVAPGDSFDMTWDLGRELDDAPAGPNDSNEDFALEDDYITSVRGGLYAVFVFAWATGAPTTGYVTVTLGNLGTLQVPLDHSLSTRFVQYIGAGENASVTFNNHTDVPLPCNIQLILRRLL